MSLPRRPRRLAALATVAGLALGLPALGTTLLAGPASSADPAEDCIAPFPVAELAVGDPVTGLTVVQGTDPVPFTGEVLGVVEDGVGPGLDMVMADLDMPALTTTGGIWQGMSGSPVYAADGRLVGAVAYGLSFGPSPIAGITPFEDMDDYLAAPAPARVRLDAPAARAVAAAAGISARGAAQGFRELPMPMGVTGVTPRRLAQSLATGPDFLEHSSYVLGRASAAAATPETMVAGGNIGVSASYGDVTMAGVGTVTSVCRGRVVGFGHPMGLLGSTTLGLHPADAVYLQPDSLGAPFKVANVGPVVGTISEDRTTGVTGSFGPGPSAATITSTVTVGSRTRTGTSTVSVPEMAAETAFFQLVGNQDRVVDGPSRGSEVLSWTITGTEYGAPYSLTHTDRFTGTDLAYESANGVAETVFALTALDGVTVGSVTAQAEVAAAESRHTLGRVQQWRGGAWVPVTKRAPALARAGHRLRLRLVLGGSAGTRVVRLAPFVVPKKATARATLAVTGGDGSSLSPSGGSVAALRSELAERLRHDQVRVQLASRDRVDLGGGGGEEEMRVSAKPPAASYSRTQVLGPLAHVVAGQRTLRVVIRR